MNHLSKTLKYLDPCHLTPYVISKYSASTVHECDLGDLSTYVSGGSALLGEISLLTMHPRSCLVGLEIFHINATGRAGPHSEVTCSKGSAAAIFDEL